MKKQPKTIADLKINLIFERANIPVKYEDFISYFIFNNYELVNYEIKPNKYTFKILINDKLISFRIFVLKSNDDSIYDNRLTNLMFQLYTEISTYLFDNKIYDVLGSIKFETKDSKTFTIKYEVFPF